MILGVDKRQSVVTSLPDQLRARDRKCVSSVSVESRNCLLLDSFRYRAGTEQEPSRNREEWMRQKCISHDNGLTTHIPRDKEVSSMHNRRPIFSG